MSPKSSRRVLTILAVLGSMLLFVACAPRQAAFEDTEDVQEVILPSWSAESDCSVCHVVETASSTDLSCAYAIHVPEGVECTTCHLDDAGDLTQAHQDYAVGEDVTRLKSTRVEDAVCEECHVKAEIALITADSLVLTDSKGVTVNPHDRPSNEDHDASPLRCANCHKIHQAEAPGETALRVCSGCHHQGVFECGTCH